MDAGLLSLCLSNNELIINLAKEVFPTPKDPSKKKISPTSATLDNFIASSFNSSKLLSNSDKIFNYKIEKALLKLSTKSVFSQVKCPLSDVSLPKCP